MINSTIDVIIPVCNQYDSLKKVIYAFSLQNINKNMFEIIIIDDGSTDDLSSESWNQYYQKYGLKGKIIHRPNGGRAAARNTGLNISEAEIIVFCDADRFPKQNFLEQHLYSHQTGNNIVIGASFDYFGKFEHVKEKEITWNMVNKFSRLPSYFKKVSAIFDNNGKTTSPIAWLSFLVGNSSIKKKFLCDVGGFDESFIEWGFEHFELAYRLWLSEFEFSLNSLAINYHIPHPRIDNFYNQAIIKNSKILSKKHPKINEQVVENFVNGKINVDMAENNIFIKE